MAWNKIANVSRAVGKSPVIQTWIRILCELDDVVGRRSVSKMMEIFPGNFGMI